MTQRQISSAALTPAQVTGILALAEAADATDGVAPLSEHVLLHLRYDSSRPGPGLGRDFVLTVNGEVAG